MGRDDLINPQVVVLRRTGQGRLSVLLVKRADTGVWTLPGGRREPGETLADAAIRETKEETGYGVNLIRQLGTYNLPHLPALGKVFVFVGEAAEGATITNNEITDVRWFSVTQLPKKLLPYQHKKIKDAIAGKQNVTVSLPHSRAHLLLHYWWAPVTLARVLAFYQYLARKRVN